MTRDQLGVRVTYRDRNRRPTYTKTYTLCEYTDMLREDLLRIITDVEDLCYAVNHNAPKEEWSDETFSAFNKIKHKLLDHAGDVGRMPENMIEYSTEPLTEYMARLINEEEGVDPYGESRLGPKNRYQGVGESHPV